MVNQLKELYERITFLRNKGVKMKDIAERAKLSPSVLSAMYSSVLPGYFKNIEKGMSSEEALDNSLVWVNNISKKKMLGLLPQMKSELFSMEVVVKEVAGSFNPFLMELEQGVKRSVHHIQKFCGIYNSYSISSSSKNLKTEPYLITVADNGSYVEVGHTNYHASTHWGFGMMNGMSHLYLTFNENQAPQLSLFNICLKLPMYDRPPFLCGMYLCFDYNYNPIARRILLVKQSDSTNREEFMKLKGELKSYESLNEEERIYYDYTCQAGDVIRMYNLPTPQMTTDDLIMEKKITEILK